MKLITHLAIRILLIASMLALCLQNTACSPADIQKASRASSDLAGDFQDTTNAVADLYHTGKISVEVKDRLVQILLDGAKAGKSFNSAIIAARTQPDKGASALPGLASNFDLVVKPFLDFLTEIGRLSAEDNASLSTALSALKLSILTIATILHRTGKATKATTRLLRREQDSWEMRETLTALS